MDFCTVILYRYTLLAEYRLSGKMCIFARDDS